MRHVRKSQSTRIALDPFSFLNKLAKKPFILYNYVIKPYFSIIHEHLVYIYGLVPLSLRHSIYKSDFLGQKLTNK